MKHVLIALMMASSLLAGCGVLNQRTGEEALFATLTVDDNYEVRMYEPVIIAQTTADGPYATATRIGYERLTRYVSGHNQAKQTISIDAPVVISDSNKAPNVALTLPYYEEYVDDQWVISVALPESYRLNTLPKPIDQSITFKALPTLKVAVVKFSGYKSQNLVDRQTTLLNQWVATQKFITTSSPRSVIYNSPRTVPVLRRHEVHVNIQ